MARTPAIGARVVARAWSDPEFKARLLADGSTACREMGVEVDAMKLVVVENTAEVHNVVVCTLCSCYPRNLLGLPPDWYKNRAYRARTVREPRKVLSEFGLELGGDIQVRVHDFHGRYALSGPARATCRHRRLGRGRGLATLVGRDAMIGVARAAEPAAETAGATCSTASRPPWRGCRTKAAVRSGSR